MEGITLSPLDGPYGLHTNTVKDNLPEGKIQNIVNVLMEVLYDSLRFNLIYLIMLRPEKRRFVGVLTVK